jgi:hypothetical protein
MIYLGLEWISYVVQNGCCVRIGFGQTAVKDNKNSGFFGTGLCVAFTGIGVKQVRNGCKRNAHFSEMQ